MSQQQATRNTARLSRRAALRAGAGMGAVGAGLVAGNARPALGAANIPVAQAAWRMEHLEFDLTPVNASSMVRAGSGPPQRGDWFYVDAPIFATDDVGGAQIGMYECFGAWTHAANDTAASEQRLTSVRFDIFGQGLIVGIINEGGPLGQEPLVGVVQGGTAAYIGAGGTFTQTILSGEVPGVRPGTTVVRAGFDLILPNLG